MRFITKSGKVLTKGDLESDGTIDLVRVNSRWAKHKTYDTLRVTIYVPRAQPGDLINSCETKFSPRRLAALAHGEARRKFPPSWNTKPVRVGQRAFKLVTSWHGDAVAYTYIFKRTQKNFI